jgi:hypothetical protein
MGRYIKGRWRTAVLCLSGRLRIFLISSFFLPKIPCTNTAGVVYSEFISSSRRSSRLPFIHRRVISSKQRKENKK